MPATAALQIATAPSPKIASRQSRMRERIVAESAKLFLARGFAAVSVDEIVAAAEIARSSFYRFFANREELLASTIRPVFESGVQTMATIAGRPPRETMEGIFDMYLALWASAPDTLRLATRMGGTYFRLFQDVHTRYRQALTDLLRRVEGTGILLNDSGDYSARLLARTAVPVLEVYAGDPQLASLFRRTMRGLLLKP